jgi:hypothetical protein
MEISERGEKGSEDFQVCGFKRDKLMESYVFEEKNEAM